MLTTYKAKMLVAVIKEQIIRIILHRCECCSRKNRAIRLIVARRSVLFFVVTQLAIRGYELYPRQFAANTGRTGQKMISTVCITKLQGIGSPRNAHYCHLPEIIKQLPVIIEIHGLHHTIVPRARLSSNVNSWKLKHPFLLVSCTY